MDAYGQIGTGIIPLPGTPAYEAALRNLLNAQPGQGGASIGDTQSQALNAYNTLRANTGQSFGIADPAIAKLGGATGGTTGGSSGSMFSNQATGAGLLGEILSLIRGTGEKQFATARNRLNEDYGTAREQKIHDLARRGLFRAGTGEEEMQREIDKPYTRGLEDLESNMADANTDLGLRKADILAQIEARARQQAAQSLQNASMTGTGYYRPFSQTGGSGTSYGSGAGSGGFFGASFSSGTPSVGGGAGGGGPTQTTTPWSDVTAPGWQGAPPGTPPPAWNPGDPLAPNFLGPDAGAGPMPDPTAFDPSLLSNPSPTADPYNFNQYFQAPSRLLGTGQQSLYGGQTPNMATLNYFTSQPAYAGGSSGGFSGYL